MTNINREKLIAEYFQMWVKRDFTGLNNVFDEGVYYSECYGPEYFCVEEIWPWIEAMTAKQIVLKWRIKRFIHTENTTIVEWYFKEQQGEVINDFDGVSIIDFNDQNKIAVIKEFESKAEHIVPYHKQ